MVWSKNRQNPSYPRDFSAVRSFGVPSTPCQGQIPGQIQGQIQCQIQGQTQDEIQIKRKLKRKRKQKRNGGGRLRGGASRPSRRLPRFRFCFRFRFNLPSI